MTTGVSSSVSSSSSSLLLSSRTATHSSESSSSSLTIRDSTGTTTESSLLLESDQEVVSSSSSVNDDELEAFLLDTYTDHTDPNISSITSFSSNTNVASYDGDESDNTVADYTSSDDDEGGNLSSNSSSPSSSSPEGTTETTINTTTTHSCSLSSEASGQNCDSHNENTEDVDSMLDEFLLDATLFDLGSPSHYTSFLDVLE